VLGGMFGHNLEGILVVVDGRPELTKEFRRASGEL